MKRSVFTLFAMLIFIATKAVIIDDYTFEAKTIEGVNMRFKVTNEEEKTCAVAIDAIKKSTEGTVTIPSEVEGYTVTSINNNAFQECINLTSITMPDCLKTISSSAFYKCIGLKSIKLSKNLTWIGSYAFEGCKNLESIDIPEGVSDIYGSVFKGCTALKSVSLPINLNTIGESAFYNCTSLEDIQLPEGLTTIGSSAFKNCTALESIVIPSKISAGSSSSSPFQGCSSLEKVTIECESVVMWFQNNTAIKEIHLGSLVSNVFSKNLRGVSELTFLKGCTSLEVITIATDNSIVDSRDNCNAIIETVSNTLLFGCKTTKIPDTVTKIAKNAFKGCTGLSEITIPSSITSIAEGAFGGCSGLINVISYIKQINLFNQKSSINSIFDTKTKESAILHVPYGMTKVYSYNKYWSFQNIIEMEGTESEKTFITFADAGAKESCVKYWDINEDGEISLDEANYVTEIPNYFADQKITSFEEVKHFPNIMSIGDFAFYHCSELTSFTIPSNVTTIGKSAFDGTSLLNISIPNGVESLGNGIFNGCTNLKSIELPNSLTSIGSKAFSGSGLVEVTIPVGISDIGNELFNGCKKLISVNLKAAITSIGNKMFYNCSNLNNVAIPSTVTIIGESAFENCSSLRFIDLPENLTTIENAAFYKSALSRITIPASVTSIGANALTGSYIYSNMVSPTTGSWQVAYTPSNIVLYVPHESIEAYKTAEGWKDFIYIQDIKPEINWKEGSVIVNVPEPGMLSQAIEGLDVASITRLIIKGKLNSEDLIYLHSSKGKIADLESLNMKDVALVPDGQCYYSYFKADKEVVGFGTHFYFYLSEEDKRKGEETFDGPYLNGSSTYYGTNLAGAFWGMGLKHIVMPSNINCAAAYAFSGCSELESVEFPNELVKVETHAFEGSKLQSINLEKTESIGHSAFLNCSRLVSIGKTNSLKYIEGCAFEGCTNLREDNGLLTIENIDSIPNRAFYGCKAIESVRLSKRLYYIGIGAFENCSRLYSVSYPTSLKKVDTSSFVGTPWLPSLPSENGVIYMGTIALRYDANSRGMDALPSSLSFRSNTTSIANNFISSIPSQQRSNFTEIVFPSSLIIIGDNAFSDFNSLKSIYSYASRPVFLGYASSAVRTRASAEEDLANNVFYGVDKKNCVLHVPSGSANKYATTNGWDFNNIVEFLIGDANGDKSIDEKDIKSIAEFIMTDKEPEGFIRRNADANGDINTNAADIVLITNIIRGK